MNVLEKNESHSRQARWIGQGAHALDEGGGGGRARGEARLQQARGADEKA